MAGFSQTNPADTIPRPDIESLAVDTSLDYDDMLEDLGDFIDSILAPRNYFLVSASASNGYFNFKNNTGTRVEPKKKLVFSPVIGYYHKTGPGLTLSANGTNTNDGFTMYQYMVTPSIDFIQSRKWVGGFSYTRYFTKDSVKFYISPLQNELNAYFFWRKSWVQPGVSLSYGWGSRQELKKRERYLLLIRPRPVIVTTTNESITDFSINTSLRHSFYWLDLSRHNDYIKFTPMIVFSAGTQRYGFNQATMYYVNRPAKTGTIGYNNRNTVLDNNIDFQAQSLSLYLRPEYNIGKFFIQPQVILDYYFPGADNNFTAVFSINAGFMF